MLPLLTFVTLIVGASASWGSSDGANSNACKTVTTQPGVDLNQFVAKRWFIHEQMATQAGNPDGRWSYCVYADYRLKDSTTVSVKNHAEEGSVGGTVHDADLCAAISDDPSKLSVGPCFLPRALFGPYWIVAYDEAEGYALVSGGQPTIPTKDGLCKTGDGVNNAGLWIFSRSPVRDEALIAKVRGIAVSKGFDPSVLLSVTQQGCTYATASQRLRQI